MIPNYTYKTQQADREEERERERERDRERTMIHRLNTPRQLHLQNHSRERERKKDRKERGKIATKREVFGFLFKR